MAKDYNQLKQRNIDFHTAHGAASPHVSVFTVDLEGAQDKVLAEFYPLDGETLSTVEDRATAYMEWLKSKVDQGCGPVNPEDFTKAQQALEDSWKGYWGLLKKHGFDKAQHGHNFDKRLEKAYDEWDRIDKLIQGQVDNEWDRRSRAPDLLTAANHIIEGLADGGELAGVSSGTPVSVPIDDIVALCEAVAKVEEKSQAPCQRCGVSVPYNESCGDHRWPFCGPKVYSGDEYFCESCASAKPRPY